jgi:hypothetical protein
MNEPRLPPTCERFSFSLPTLKELRYAASQFERIYAR